ncbi:hypothetical protein G8C93_04675 [Cellulosimicrobium cellulans]|uniref:hypothetical protein n=1 Tax=Cellulosimicrobium cellulans TaxID=1710 RepID=UPI0018845BFF|nr:hypothetical protein [Cellulosimicrobium cellulans]MBE9925186.1 hypothetical protein [Cellulosimicrobium cellulans]
MTYNGDAAAVRDLALDTLGLSATWVEPKGYRDSLALSAIDAVYSLRAHYSGVVNVLDRYRALRRSEGADPYLDSGPDLLAVIEQAGGPENAAASIFNDAKAPGTRPAVLKSVALANAVDALRRVGVTTSSELREATPARLSAARTAWLSVTGVGPVSWDYLEMNVGIQGVKADTWVIRFVTRAVDASKPVTVDRARAAVKGAADLMGVSYKALDHGIWKAESGRE